MPTYAATYINPRGKASVIDVEAPDPSQAKRSLRLRGIRATEIKPKTQASVGESKAGALLNQKLSFSTISALIETKPGIKEKLNRLTFASIRAQAG